LLNRLSVQKWLKANAHLSTKLQAAAVISSVVSLCERKDYIAAAELTRCLEQFKLPLAVSQINQLLFALSAGGNVDLCMSLFRRLERMNAPLDKRALWHLLFACFVDGRADVAHKLWSTQVLSGARSRWNYVVPAELTHRMLLCTKITIKKFCF